jgi:hypothetical protein
MAMASKATVLELTSTGVANHLNVYAGYISGATTGSFNGCPVQTCPNSVTHTITLQVKYPHGMFGALGKQVLPPTGQANTTSFDVSPSCYPIFGDPSDPECNVAISGLAHCDFSGQTLATPGPPPDWPQFRYLHSWDDYVTVVGYPGSMPGSWGATATCGASVDSCQIPTTSVCASYISPFETFDVEIAGPGATQLGAESLAEEQCSYGDPHENRAWEVIGVYNPADPGGPGSCVPTRVLLSAANTPCQ